MRIEEVFASDGVLAQIDSRYEQRHAQIEMAAAIEEVIEKQTTLVAESGTGTGKTYAYLVPTLLLAKKSIISTGTKYLQEQLFFRDIPQVKKALGVNIRVALLKGRANYLCLHRLGMADQMSLDFARGSRHLVREIDQIRKWSHRTLQGDIAEVAEVAESSRVWPLVTSTAENCLGQECKYHDECFVNLARKKAVSSDLVVINHHLYFADLCLKDTGFGALLPGVEHIVFDEAHQIPDIASVFLGSNFSTWQLLELVRDVRSAEAKEKSLVYGLLQTAEAIETGIVDARRALLISETRVAWVAAIQRCVKFLPRLKRLVEDLRRFVQLLNESAVAGSDLQRSAERGGELIDLFNSIIDETAPEGESIRWLEISKHGFRIHITPLNVGEKMKTYFDAYQQSKVFTSATLSVKQDFSHFIGNCGLPQDLISHSWESPFDYARQSILYLPEGVPPPSRSDFTLQLFHASLPLLKANRGRAFCLFTSFRVMQEFAGMLSAEAFKIFMQGQSSKSELLSAFLQSDNAVLLGTMSFWEGVDVAGSELSLVIIDKLPFEAPSDPVLRARLKLIEEKGGNPFFDYQIPRAVITLKQGAGRLIRSRQDTGVLVLGDCRLQTTTYGHVFLDSLPAMKRSSDEQQVTEFLLANGG